MEYRTRATLLGSSPSSGRADAFFRTTDDRQPYTRPCPKGGVLATCGVMREYVHVYVHVHVHTCLPPGG